ncbi:MAG: AMP-binding protein, partial [Gammaproteobacteria bacterium]|nr:AMP-binding protein [Gammaproteobacteria bacterium]
MKSLGDWIRHNAEWAGERLALGLGEERYTYWQMDRAVAQRRNLLVEVLGAEPGDRIAFLDFNACEVPLLLFACARAGCVFMPLNNRLAVPELRAIVAHSEVRYLCVGGEFAPVAAEIQQALPKLQCFNMDTDYPGLLARAEERDNDDLGALDDPALLIYTSGTTGQAKGVLHTQRALFYNALNAIHAQEMSVRDHVLSVLPLFHSGGLNIQTSPAFYAGARVSLLRRFDAGETLRAIETLRPTLFLAVPAVIQALVDHPRWMDTDLSCLRMVGTGSSTVPDALLNAWHDRGVPATQIYGLTESAPTAICLPIADAQAKQGSAGKPAMHCEARIVDDDGRIVEGSEPGEIQLRGPNLFSAYFKEPELTASAFDGSWFRTGDIGHRDADGFYTIDDRKKDVIISGGENIYPAEIENILADMPELAEYAVVGAPSERWGQAPVACIVLREGESLDERQLLARFNGLLARYKHPRSVLFLPALPRNAMGKVLKYQLR